MPRLPLDPRWEEIPLFTDEELAAAYVRAVEFNLVTTNEVSRHQGLPSPVAATISQGAAPPEPPALFSEAVLA